MSADRAALVGRERHLGELRMLVDAVNTSRGGVVVLSGEAGAGKTRLAEEAVDLATAAGVDVSWATGWASSAAPLATWCDLVAGVDLDAAAVAASVHASTEVDPDAARSMLIRSLVAELRRDLGPRAVLFVVDDVQWCDPMSVLALEALAVSLRGSELGLLVTLRDDGDGTASRFEGLTRRGRHLVVPALTETELGVLALRLTGRTLSSPAIARLHDRSAGNVLFATELLSAAERTGSVDAARHGEGTSSAPAMYVDRMARLSEPTRRVLEMASVIGRHFRMDLLAEALGIGEEAVLGAVGEAHAAGFVRSSGIGGYEFTHPLMVEACTSSISLPRRIRLHRDVGEALERMRERGFVVAPATLAYHYAIAASAGAAPKAVRYAAASGRHNMEQLAYEDALRDFTRALEALDLCPADDATRVDVLIELGDATAAAGDLPAARRAYAAAAQLARTNGWPDRFARAALGVGSGPGGFEMASFDRDQITLLQEAASVGEGSLRAQVLARLSVALSLDPDAARRVRLCEEAIAAARSCDDPLALGYALASWCDVIAGPADVERRLEAIAEILTCASTTGDTRLELLARRLRVVALLEAGALSDVDDEIAAFAAQADRLGQVVYSWYVPLWRALRAVMEGRLDDAERWRDDAARLGEAAHSENAAMLTGSQLAMLRCELGDVTANSFFEEVTIRWPELVVMSRPGLAYGHAAAGNLDRAREVLAVIDLDHYSVDALGSEWLPCIVMIAYAAAITDSVPLASRLYDVLEPFRSRHAIDGIGCYDLGSVERPLGMLAAARGNSALSASHFEAALHEHRRVGARLLVAGTLRNAGHCLGDEQALVDADQLYAALGLDRTEPVAPAHEAVDARYRRNVLRREGELWLVGFDATTAHVRDSKGIRDLALLLARPHTEIHVLDLVADGPTLRSDALDDPIDDVAARNYRQRLLDIEAELADADECADVARSEQLQTERDALIAELSAAYGLGGRARRRSDSSERARSAVTQRIRDAITRLEAADPGLGAHLRHSIRTGTFCSYRPEHPVPWEL